MQVRLSKAWHLYNDPFFFSAVPAFATDAWHCTLRLIPPPAWQRTLQRRETLPLLSRWQNPPSRAAGQSPRCRWWCLRRSPRRCWCHTCRLLCRFSATFGCGRCVKHACGTFDSARPEHRNSHEGKAEHADIGQAGRLLLLRRYSRVGVVERQVALADCVARHSNWSKGSKSTGTRASSFQTLCSCDKPVSSTDKGCREGSCPMRASVEVPLEVDERLVPLAKRARRRRSTAAGCAHVACRRRRRGRHQLLLNAHSHDARRRRCRRRRRG